jgi:hypothetical protein
VPLTGTKPGAALELLEQLVKVRRGLRPVVMAAVSVRRIRPLTLILLAAAVVLVVMGVVFFASSHPLRGGVFVILAVGCVVGAWLSRYSGSSSRR